MFGKVNKFGDNWLNNNKLRAKNKSRVGKHPSPVLIVLNKQLLIK